jgi:hypothetical protein
MIMTMAHVDHDRDIFVLDRIGVADRLRILFPSYKPQVLKVLFKSLFCLAHAS